MPKKAQVTAFIIVGVVLLIIIALVLSFRFGLFEKKIVEEEVEIHISEEFKPFAENIKKCIEEFAFNTVMNFGYTGFCFDCQKSKIEFNWINVTLYTTNEIGTIEDWQAQISDHIKNNLQKQCVVNTSASGIEVSYGTPDVKTKIEPTRVFVEIDWPISFGKRDVKEEINKFTINVHTRLGELNSILPNLISEILKDPVCVSCIGEYASKNDLIVQSASQNKHKIYIILAKSRTKGEQPYYVYVGK